MCACFNILNATRNRFLKSIMCHFLNKSKIVSVGKLLWDKRNKTLLHAGYAGVRN